MRGESNRPQAPDRPRGWYHGWNIVAVCVLAQVAGLALTTNCFSLFVSGWSKEFATPVSTLAAGWTALSLTVAVVAPFAGMAADRVPARWLFGLSVAGLVLFHLAMGFVAAGWQIVALYVLVLPLAMGFSATVPSQAIVSRWFARRVGLAMGLTAFGIAIAGVVLPPVIVRLLPVLGWRKLWWSAAGLIAVVVLPLVLVALRDRPRGPEGASYLLGRETTTARPALSLRDVVRRPNFWRLIGATLPLNCGYAAIAINLAPIVSSRGLSIEAAGGLLSFMSAAALASKLGCGLLADRLGNRIPLVALDLCSAAGLAILLLAPGRLPVLAVALALVGMTGGLWTLLASATAAEFGADGFGRAFGLGCALTTLGSLAPPLLARSQEATGSYAAGLGVLVALAALGAAAALRLKAPPRPANGRLPGLAGAADRIRTQA